MTVDHREKTASAQKRREDDERLSLSPEPEIPEIPEIPEPDQPLEEVAPYYEPKFEDKEVAFKEPLFEEKAEVKIEESPIVESAFGEPIEPKVNLISTSDGLDAAGVSEAEKTSLETEILKEESVIRKKTCPNCGNTNKDQIREFDDKTKILYTYPRIYGKMYRCGQCGTEWR